MSEHGKRPDHELERLVTDELRWSPGIDSDLISVAVQNGTVTLTGQVASVPQLHWAERTTIGVPGVRAVDLDLRVGPLWDDDADITREADESLELALDVPDPVRATTHQHVVTLSGEVQWQHQREAADRAVRYGHAVRSVVNDIEVRPMREADHLRRHLGSGRSNNDTHRRT